MKKEKVIYLAKVWCVFAILLLIFAQIFNFVIQITMPMNKAIQTSTSGNLIQAIGYMACLIAISILAQKLALRFIKKPDCV
jgi:hypothetical protein